MPGDADVALVFFEPGQFDPLGGVPEEFFGQGWQDGGGDSEAHELGGLVEVRAEVGHGEGLFSRFGRPREFFQKLASFGDGEFFRLPAKPAACRGRS